MSAATPLLVAGAVGLLGVWVWFWGVVVRRKVEQHIRGGG